MVIVQLMHTDQKELRLDNAWNSKIDYQNKNQTKTQFQILYDWEGVFDWEAILVFTDDSFYLKLQTNNSFCVLLTKA